MKSFSVLVFCVAVGIALGEEFNVTDLRIIGGMLTSIEKHPHQVSLLSRENKYHCGGSIIGHQYVLTSASCYKKRISKCVRAGSSRTYSGGKVHKVVNVEIHKDFCNTEYRRDHDIAILKVKPPFTYSSKIKPIPLWSKDFDFDSERVQISGFGATDPTEEDSRTLRVVSVPVINKSKCNRILENSYNNEIGASRFCTGHWSGGKNPCKGDEGSAVIFEKKQIGIVSVSRGCGRKESPGINTDIYHHHAWIYQTVGKMSLEIESECDCNEMKNEKNFCECETEFEPLMIESTNIQFESDE